VKTIALALAALALGLAIHIRNGLFHPQGMLWLTAAVMLAALGLIGPRLRWPLAFSCHGRLADAGVDRTDVPGVSQPVGSAWSGRALVCILSGILITQLVVHLFSAPAEAFEPDVRGWRLPVFMLCIAGVGAWLVIHLLDLNWLGRQRLTLLLTLHFLAGGWILTQTPEPFIDVYVFQRDGAAALLEGRNPYALTFPNIYGPDAFVYAPHVMEDDRLLFGYPYMPLSLLLAVPGHLLFGDFRWAHLIAATSAGLFIGNLRPGPVAPLAAAVFLFTPRMFYVLEMGWTEPQAAMLLAAVVYVIIRSSRSLSGQAGRRHPDRSEGTQPAAGFDAQEAPDPPISLRMPRQGAVAWSRLAVPVTLGLLLAVKQYLVVLLPVTLLLAGRPIDWRRWLFMMLATGLAALVVTLPLALWDPSTFIRSVITLQIHQPFRLDALSYTAWMAQAGGPRLPAWVPFAAVIAVALGALWRLPVGPRGFSAAAAISLLAFFALNKQAFANYYFLVIAGLCCATAAMDHTEEKNA
jgi:hypothetical protein